MTVRNRPTLVKMYKEVVEEVVGQTADWINADPKGLTATVTSFPTFEDVSPPVEVGQVVAFLSR
ncbi:MAG: hypothetical protein R3C11_07565 [Planctomycetaceae bacterium]